MIVSDQQPGLIPEGMYAGELVAADPFASPFGPRIRLAFRVLNGPHSGLELIQSASATRSHRGKLADLLRGLGAVNGTDETAQALIGGRCQIAVRHERTRAGRAYATIVQTFP